MGIFYVFDEKMCKFWSKNVAKIYPENCGKNSKF